MVMVDRPTTYMTCPEAVWIYAQHLQCEGLGDHKIHFVQYRRHIVRWWGPIGATKIDPPEFPIRTSI